jgi:bacterioferritin
VKGSPKVLKLLNDVLRKELTGINQYFLHSRICANWGYEVLAKHSREESIDEMKHADSVIERILFLEGTPNMSAMDAIVVGRNVKEQLESDLKLELNAIELLRPGIELCGGESDFTTRELLEKILEEEEHHVDWLESQLHQIEEMGYENYLTLQVRKAS